MVLPDEFLTPKRKKVRSKILEAAQYLFARYGYFRTAISDISERANIADGTLYLYFHNKEDLLIHAVNEALETLTEEIISILEKEQNPLGKFYAFFDANITVFSNHSDLARLIVVELFRIRHININDPVFSGFQKYFSYLKDICQEAIDKGFLREVNSEILAFHTHAIIDYLVGRWILHDYDFDMTYNKNKMLDIMIHGLIP